MLQKPLQISPSCCMAGHMDTKACYFLVQISPSCCMAGHMDTKASPDQPKLRYGRTYRYHATRTPSSSLLLLLQKFRSWRLKWTNINSICTSLVGTRKDESGDFCDSCPNNVSLTDQKLPPSVRSSRTCRLLLIRAEPMTTLRHLFLLLIALFAFLSTCCQGQESECADTTMSNDDNKPIKK